MVAYLGGNCTAEDGRDHTREYGTHCTNCTLSNNSVVSNSSVDGSSSSYPALARGGGVMVTSGNFIKILTMDVLFDGGAMVSNSAEEGGALALPVSVMDATTLGECVSNPPTWAVRLVGVTIDGNRAVKAGGGLLLEGSVCTIIDLQDVVLTNNNVSTALGGGVALRAVKASSAASSTQCDWQLPQLTILRGAISDNIASAGGGVFVSGVPSVGLRDAATIGSPTTPPPSR